MATEQPPDDQMLRRLERRLDEASAAAERLIAEAAAQALRGDQPPTDPAPDQRATDPGDAVSGAGEPDGRPPPAGWQARRDPPPASDRPPTSGRPPVADRDAELIADVLERLRGLIPPDLQQRIAEALRELLLALRALLDWYIDRLERRRAEPVEVTDIPIA
jgi:hypothetical protein